MKTKYNFSGPRKSQGSQERKHSSVSDSALRSEKPRMIDRIKNEVAKDITERISVVTLDTLSEAEKGMRNVEKLAEKFYLSKVISEMWWNGRQLKSAEDLMHQDYTLDRITWDEYLKVQYTLRHAANRLIDMVSDIIADRCSGCNKRR